MRTVSRPGTDTSRIMRSMLLLGGVIFMMTTPLSAQEKENVKFKRRNFEDIDAMKKAEDRIDKGDEYREKANDRIRSNTETTHIFKKALHEYLKAQEFNPDNAALNYKIANCYLYTTEKHKAIEHMKAARDRVDELDDLDDYAFYYMGWVHQLEKDFDKALEHYERFREEASNSDVEQMEDRLDQRIEGCEAAPGFIENDERVWVDNMETLNTPANEYSPAITTDGRRLLFSSDRENEHEPDERGNYDLEIYRSRYDEGSWSDPQRLDTTINTPNDDVVGNFSYDGQKMLLFQYREGDADIYESKREGLSWTEPVSFSPQINRSGTDETYASYNYDGITLYYCTNQKARNRKGDRDIYQSGLIDEDQREYGKGQTAGRHVNTDLAEGPVYMHPNGKLMYFASKGHNSMGGYDIFVSRKKVNQWQKPKNLGYPINTPYDDQFFAITADEKTAYIASDRPGGKGGMDIYKVTFWGPEKPVMTDTEDKLIASLAEPVKSTEIEGKVEVEEKKSLTVFKGKIIDELAQKPVKADIEIVDNESGEPVRTVQSNKATGKFLISLPAGKNYGIRVEAEGYLFHSENFDLPKDDDYNLVQKTIGLKNIEVGSKIALRNVFFETGKAEIQRASHTELDRLVELLEEVPALTIELSGHTDNQGSEKLNKELSQKRAEAVREYLINEGIDGSRLTAKGYGSEQPVATNKTKAGRQKNRRTEFKITGN